jgi:hypothetical protein
MAHRQLFERHLRPQDLLLVPPIPPDSGLLDRRRHTELMESTHHRAVQEDPPPQADGHRALDGL